MCTKAEVAQVLEHEFFKKEGLKDRLMRAFKLEIDAEIGKFTRKQMIAGVMMIIAALGAWFSLYYQVQSNTHSLQNGFTQNEALLIKQQNVELKEDVAELKDAFLRLDERLRNKGI